MKFIADVMLGKLAKRMRLLGYDVLYDNRADDNEIIRLALEQDRVILTRDTGLATRPLAKNHFFIESDDPDEQLKQLVDHFSLLSARHSLTRCSICNESLTPISKSEAKDLVPEHVYKKHIGFFQCNTCRKIYWKGTHVESMRN